MIELALKKPEINSLTYPYIHPVHVLNLAKEHDVKIILPAVFYFLSLYNLTDILRADHPKLNLNHPSSPTPHISPEDIQAYTLMYQFRIQLMMDFVRRTCGERPIARSCQSKETCDRVFNRLSSRLSRSWKTRSGPLHFMIQAQNEILDNPEVCGTCRRAFRQDVTALREETWKNLPTIIGLPSWEELEAIDLTRTTTK